MSDSQAAGRVYSTKELAERLGVSTNMARRYGLVWEELTREALPQQPGRGRLYSQATMEALESARAWLIQNPSESIETALRATLDLEGETPKRESKNVPGLLSKAEIGDAVREAVREGISEAMQPLLTQLEAVRAENAGLKAKLEALPAPSEGSEDRQRIIDLEKRNEALRAALEAKERAEQGRKRSWWRVWAKSTPNA